MAHTLLVPPRMRLLRSLVTLVSTSSALACGGPGATVSDQSPASGTQPMPLLPFEGGTGDQSPWGGSDPTRWRPEAVLANAASEALNGAWSRSFVKDAITAVPVKMLSSDFFEFGDGQSNAAPSFEWWSSKRPPIVATLIRFNDGSPSRVVIRIDRDLPITSGGIEIRWTSSDVPQLAVLVASKTSAGDWTAEWTPPASLGLDASIATTTMLIHPQGWNDWFPLWFRFAARSIDDFKTTVPASMRSFADGGDIQDHERVGATYNPGASGSVRQRLQLHTFGATRYDYFHPLDIHAVFPWNGRNIVTAVGSGWTWVADLRATPFKVMYTCFERRRADLEAVAQDGGVPSGGGWHKITDPAETVLNDLESGPLVLGSAMMNPVPQSVLPSGGFSYNLTDVATIRFLAPGEALITPRGGTIFDASGNAIDQSNYHWYFFQQSDDVCTEEWVHPFVPDAAFDFAGPPISIEFWTNASTSWGQNVYVVGDAPELGGWDTHRAVALSANPYPNWTGTVSIGANRSVAFKFIKIDSSGNVTWENGPNRSYATPSSGSGVIGGDWRN
jgi:hypothetical protein